MGNQRGYRGRAISLTGFSLVELLVVIGIIGILISLLMPALASIQARSQEVQCQAKLRTIGQAAMLHVNDHNGYLPVAGVQHDLPGEVVDPKALGDQRGTRYTYYLDAGKVRPVPVTVALGICLGVKMRLDSRPNLEADMQKSELRRHFKCPSQAVDLKGSTQADKSWEAPKEWSSYVFNEAILGHREAETNPDPPIGKLTKIKRPAVVMFAMDGRPRDPVSHDRLLVPDCPCGKCTVWEFYERALRDPDLGSECLDFLRHRYRIQIIFVDGHVEGVPMTREALSLVGVRMGVSD